MGNDSRRLMGTDQCRWWLCRNDRTQRYGSTFPFCQGHAIEVWATVQDDHELSTELAERRAKAKPVDLNAAGWVYYLRIGDHIKIGHASDLTRRMAAYPPNTEFLAAVPGTRRDERNLHLRLAEHKAMGREWYMLRADVLAAVETAQRHPERIRGNPFDRAEPTNVNPSGVRLRSRTLRRR